MKFPFYKQLDAVDCGPTCLKMIAKYHGRNVSLEYLRNKSQYGKEGASMLGLADAAESVGLNAIGAKQTFEELITDAPLSAILHWDQYHFVVMAPDSNAKRIVIADPAKGIMKLSRKEFEEHWLTTVENGEQKGTVLLFERFLFLKKWIPQTLRSSGRSAPLIFSTI